MDLWEIWHKAKDEKGKTQIVQIRIPSVDARDAIARFPHEYSREENGFAKAPPKGADVFDGAKVLGPSGGNPAINGGVGVMQIKEAPAA